MFREFRRSNKDKVIITQSSGVPPRVLVTIEDSLSVPLYLSLPVSDCIHNLRAALDDLIHELAFLDRGAVMGGTQFPIEDSPSRFNSRKSTYLRGLSNDHIRAIESFQPYNGVDWTRTLRSISNPDKHRHLIVLQPQRPPYLYTHSSGELSETVLTMNGEETYLNKEDVLSIGFAGSTASVLETLIELTVRVGETVDRFKPDFG